jgi:energy-coupling factor transport system permease protein
LFKSLDPRVRMFWWIAMSLLAMLFSRIEPALVLALLMAVGWVSVNAFGKLVRFTLGLLPFLVIISVISLFPTMDVPRALRMAVRYYVLLGSTMLIMATTTYGEITNALRNVGRGRLSFMSISLELFALLFGLAFLTVPIASEEWDSVKEVQRARGVDMSLGNRFTQVKRGLELIQPLILRILDRIRFFGISIITLGYNPFAPRSLYRELVMSHTDRLALGTALGLVALGFVLRITLNF